MKIPLMVIGMLWLAVELLNAESFYLREADTEKAHGPYEYKDGGTVDLGTNKFFIVRSEVSERRRLSLEAKLDGIIIPKVDFRSARVADVFEFLIQASREFDKEADEDRRGVSIILNLRPEEQGRNVTFQARDISLKDILELVSRIAGVSYRIFGGVVVVDSSGKFETEMVICSYAIPLTLVKEIRGTGAKKYFEEIGVKFPEGATASYNAGARKLIVVNTLANIRTLEKILIGLGGYRLPPK